MNTQGTFWKVPGCTREFHVLPVAGVVFISICAAAALRSRCCCRRPCVSSQQNNCVWQSLCWQLVMQMEPRHILPGISAWHPCLSPFILIKPLLELALVNKISLEIITVWIITVSDFSADTEWFCFIQEPESSPHRLHCIFCSLLPVQIRRLAWAWNLFQVTLQACEENICVIDKAASWILGPK